MSNAAKHKKKAAEFELQKQFDKAIASYVRAIEVGDAEGAEVDVTLLNKVGDLTLRLGRVPEAVASYERAVEHYSAVGLFNNAIALCNKILRHAPGRAGVYLTLGRVCARKGMRGDATRNFLEYASRMRQEGRTDEAMRSLAEVAGLMPELDEVRRLVEEHAAHVGIELPTAAESGAATEEKSAASLVFLDIDYDAKAMLTPPLGEEVFEPVVLPAPPAPKAKPARTNSLDDLLIFDPTDLGEAADDDWHLDGLESTHNEDAAADLEVPSILPDHADAGATDSLIAPSGLTDALGFEQADFAGVDAEALDGLVTDEVLLEAEVSEGSDASEADAEPAASLESPLTEGDVEAEVESPMEGGGFDVDLLSLETYDEEMAADDAAMLADLATFAEPSEASGSATEPDEPTEPMLEIELPAEPEAIAEYEDTADDLTLDVISDITSVESLDDTSADTSETTADVSSENTSDDTAETAEDVSSESSSELTWISENDSDESADEPVDEPVEDLTASGDWVSVATPAEPVELPFLAFEEPLSEEMSGVDAPASGEYASFDEPTEQVVEPFATFDLDAIESIGDQEERGEQDDPDIESEVESDRLALDHELSAILEIDSEASLDQIDTVEGLEPDSEPLTAIDTPVEPLVVREPTPATPLEFLDVERDTPPESLEYLDVEPMEDVLSEDDRADLAHAAPVLVNAPRARLNPHDFILPGELPPIVYPDALLTPPAPTDPVPELTESAQTDEMVGLSDTVGVSESDELIDLAEPAEVSDSPLEPAVGFGQPDAAEAVAVEGDESASWVAEHLEEPSNNLTSDIADAGTVETVSAETAARSSFDDDLVDLDAILTPRTPAASINLALDRCTRLREEVERHPGDWARRRRLAEALLEAGQLEAGMDELAATVLGLEVEGALSDAAKVTDEMVRVAPDVVTHHHKRVELAARLADPERLRESYLDLADALVRTGQAQRAEPVYARVLELDPWDDRARAALGDAAPPPPSPTPPVKQQDDGYVSLTDWLSDGDATRDTRMRVKEPTVTGDEDADFDRLLQNFREGVARSLGDEDYESHYDLGVAYKEMGLLDDAVAEFQRALRSPTHRLPAYEALGQCFIEKGSLPVAVTVLSRALHEPGLNDEQRVGVLYLLGYACEALQRRDEARSYFQRVYATDINFRDVADRLAALDRGAR